MTLEQAAKIVQKMYNIWDLVSEGKLTRDQATAIEQLGFVIDGHEDLHDCGDCGAKAGSVHHAGCDVERCSYCGGQWISCGHSRTRKHDPLFARWSGFWPGELEARAMGIDLNTFHRKGINKIIFIKP